MSRKDKIARAKHWIDTDLIIGQTEYASENACCISSNSCAYEPQKLKIADNYTDISKTDYVKIDDNSLHCISKNVVATRPMLIGHEKCSFQDLSNSDMKGDNENSEKTKGHTDKWKAKKKCTMNATAPIESPHDSVEEFSSDNDSTEDNKKWIIEEVENREDTNEKKETAPMKKQKRLSDTGLFLSRRTSYRMSRSSLSPHISPVSQSQVQLLFTPNTSF